MSIKISSINKADRDEWLATCLKCSYATFFHTPYWCELFTNYKTSARKICFSDGRSAILPLTYQTVLKGLVKVYQSMPACTFGGWISSDVLEAQHCRLLLDYLMSLGNLLYRENPYDSILKSIEFDKASEDFTSTIPISEGYDRFFESSDSAHRKAVRKATQSAIEVITAETMELWDKYAALYQKSISRWKDREIYSGTYYNEYFFRRVMSLDKSLRTLWIATYKGEPASGILCFYWNRHAVAWHGAGDEQYFSMRPNNILYNTAIMDACRRGLDWFDCNPSGGIKGVIQFKKFMGAVELRSRVIDKKSLLRRIRYS